MQQIVYLDMFNDNIFFIINIIIMWQERKTALKLKFFNYSGTRL